MEKQNTTIALRVCKGHEGMVHKNREHSRIQTSESYLGCLACKLSPTEFHSPRMVAIHHAPPPMTTPSQWIHQLPERCKRRSGVALGKSQGWFGIVTELPCPACFKMFHLGTLKFLGFDGLKVHVLDFIRIYVCIKYKYRVCYGQHGMFGMLTPYNLCSFEPQVFQLKRATKQNAQLSTVGSQQVAAAMEAKPLKTV